VQVGFRWLHRTLDSLQALQDALNRTLFSSAIAGQLSTVVIFEKKKEKASYNQLSIEEVDWNKEALTELAIYYVCWDNFAVHQHHYLWHASHSPRAPENY
jgi:hypothetical protein